MKGVTRPEDAKEAVARGAKGVVVSNYRGGNAVALTGTLLLVAPVVEAVGDRIPGARRRQFPPSARTFSRPLALVRRAC